VIASDSRPRKVGRRPGTSQTREVILAAAQRCFAEQGYAETTIRQIARTAEVDHTLVIHFFGSKEELFAATLRANPPIGDLTALAREGEPGGLGARLVRGYLARWEDPDSGPWIMAVVRAASASPSASAVLASFITDEVMMPLARDMATDHAEIRANLAGAQLLGVATARYILRTEPLASLSREAVVAFLAPIIQHSLAGNPASVTPTLD
jgi:AcrR family transcriptional regulator